MSSTSFVHGLEDEAGIIGRFHARRGPDEGQDVVDIRPDDFLVLDQVLALLVDLAEGDRLFLRGPEHLGAEIFHQPAE
jgi:hypothetical protein